MEARQFAADFLENLVTFFGVNVIVESQEDEDEGVIRLNVPSTHLNGFFIGQNGDTLRSFQNLTNMALKSNGYQDTSATVDVAGYKKQQDQRLQRHVQKVAQDVKTSGKDHPLRPMNAYERRVVHRALADIDGVESESTGEGRARQVVIKKSEASDVAGSEENAAEELDAGYSEEA
jgi:spoIIIJ-associated protein